MCASCLECPLCFNILSIMSGDKKKEEEPFFFYCKFCFWNSKNYAISSKTSDELVSGNFDVTSLIIKNLENLIVKAFEIQKIINNESNNKSLIKIMEKIFFKKRKENMSSLNFSKQSDSKLNPENNLIFNAEFHFYEEVVRISPFTIIEN